MGARDSSRALAKPLKPIACTDYFSPLGYATAWFVSAHLGVAGFANIVQLKLSYYGYGLR
jgi:hypothetical protein